MAVSAGSAHTCAILEDGHVAAGLWVYIIIGLYREHWGYIGIMEKKMETTVQGLGFRV